MPGYARLPGLGSNLSTVISYTDTAARDAAMPTPLEGTMVYLQDIKMVQVYNGSAWTSIGSGDINPVLVAGM